MVRVEYVYPNVMEIIQRGGLTERWQLARKSKCDYIEIPADFVKNKSEIEKTGLELGVFLTQNAIAVLYNRDEEVPPGAKYILHTEPSLARENGFGLLYQPPLRWNDEEWVERFTQMTISVSRFLKSPATVIEIHPGDRRNHFEDIALSTRLLLSKYSEAFGVEPLILIENRTRQRISSGRDILNYWDFLLRTHPDLENKAGIVLDVQQLYTATKKRFLEEIEAIPPEAIKGYHIHRKHQVPCSSDEIPWRQVFNMIRDNKNDLLINPEVHHKNKVIAAITFCETMLRG